MGSFKELDGDIFDHFRTGRYDVIIQGNNCFNVQGGGIAPLFVQAFGTDKFPMEDEYYREDINKLGTIDYQTGILVNGRFEWAKSNNLFKGCKVVVNCYTQYGFSKNHSNNTDIPLNYNALALCLQKINHTFRGMTIGLPQIGCGLGGGDWNIVREMIQYYLIDMDIVVVNYQK